MPGFYVAVSKNIPYVNREISWLYFNDRVLQEAADSSVPLIERMRFLAIFSSNLDEFYRVRVATLNRLSDLNEKSKEVLGYNPKKILNEIKNIVVRQERKFELLYERIIKELAAEKIFILDERQLNVSRGIFVREYFRERVFSILVPIIIDEKRPMPELRDRGIYFFVRLSKLSQKQKPKLVLIEVPESLSRFLVLPETNELKFIILLDDIIRYCLDDMFFAFDYEKIEAFSIQLTRDAELDMDKEVSEKFIESLSKSLLKRRKGRPMRLLYDTAMPMDMLEFLSRSIGITSDSLIPGNRYHNFKDFIAFPNVGGPRLENPKVHALQVKGLSINASLLAEIAKRDYLVNTPYQSFDYIIHFLREAAIDPKVSEISITLYRLAENSRVINALINAAKNGKKVLCLIELKARFDEQANIYWSRKLQDEGIAVMYGISGYKVHSKVCLVTRVEKNKPVFYGCLSTGNFNEKSARIYADHTLFTANKAITAEIFAFFKALQKNTVPKGFKHLAVSPTGSRSTLMRYIEKEMKLAKTGKKAYMILKMNSLSDEKLIAKLYEASNAGVKIQMIVRGMCCLVPGVKDYSENIRVISIVDKYLEHARVYIFGNGGNEILYLSSADLMTRNLDNRVEVGFPIYNPELKKEVRKIIDIQLQDDTKAREINSRNTNKYYRTRSKVHVRAQIDIYNYFKNIKSNTF